MVQTSYLMTAVLQVQMRKLRHKEVGASPTLAQLVQGWAWDMGPNSLMLGPMHQDKAIGITTGIALNMKLLVKRQLISGIKR